MTQRPRAPEAAPIPTPHSSAEPVSAENAPVLGLAIDCSREAATVAVLQLGSPLPSPVARALAGPEKGTAAAPPTMRTPGTQTPASQAVPSRTDHAAGDASLRGLPSCLANVIACQSTPVGSRTAVSLAPTLQSVLRTAGLPPSRCDFVAVTYGPGSFTSLRIGLTTAKAFAYAANCPLLGVHTLDVMLVAAQIQAFQAGLPVDRPVMAHAVLPAYRGEFYTKSIQFLSPEPPTPSVAGGTAFDTSSDDNAIRAALQRYRHFRASRGQVSADERTVSDWACQQADPALPPVAEDLVAGSLWCTLQKAGLRPLGPGAAIVDSLAGIKTAPDRVPQWLVASEPDVLDRVDIDPEATMPMPSSPDSAADQNIASKPALYWCCDLPARVRMAAMGWLASRTLTVTHPQDWQPEGVLPMYYRRSAAEEQFPPQARSK